MRLLALVVAGVIVLRPVSPAALQSGDGWVNARTTHFNIVSNANDREIQRTAAKLEEFVEMVSRLFNARSTAQGPVTVVAFRDDRSFRPFKPLYNGKPSNISGWFQRRGDEMLIALDINAATEDRPYAVIFHEYTHLLTMGTDQAWPAWLLEGLAEFYSSFETQGTEARLGAPIAEHVALLRDVPMIPLPELFAVDQKSPTYNEGQRQNIFYAQSWALVHYLMLGNKSARQPQLRQFIRALTEGANVDVAFKSSFQTDYARMETEVRSYVSRQAYPGLSYQLKQAAATAAVAITPLRAAQSQSHLGHLLLSTGRPDEAEGLFKKALALDPSAPEPREGLGFLAAARKQPEATVEHLREAIVRKSGNYLAHYTYAATLQGLAFKGGATPAPETVRSMLEGARTAAALRPGFLGAHHLLGYLYLAGRLDPSEGIRAVSETQKLFPRDARTAITLAALHVRRGDYAAAKAGLEATLAMATGNDAADARRMLAQVEPLVAGSEPRPGATRPAAVAPAPDAAPVRPAPASAVTALPNELSSLSQITGVLSALECGGKVQVLVLSVRAKPVRFAVAPTLRIFRPSTVAAVSLTCGPLDAAATVYFNGGADPVLQGEAVAIVLQPKF
jgi:tetratricopeptide (TPR) repeat protein